MSALKKLILFAFIFCCAHVYAQNQPAPGKLTDSNVSLKADTTIVAKDTVIKKKHDPAKATRRSAIIPGWGQAYNGQYWKIPLVYAALAIPAATFVYNNKWYKKTRDAYSYVVSGDTADYNKIDPKLVPLINSPQSLQFYRNQFRRDRDYSILFFMIAWGINVVDATVFGHLKDFDVSDDLSLHVSPTYNPLTKKVNVGLALNFKNAPQRLLPSQ